MNLPQSPVRTMQVPYDEPTTYPYTHNASALSCTYSDVG